MSVADVQEQGLEFKSLMPTVKAGYSCVYLIYARVGTQRKVDSINLLASQGGELLI